MGSYEIEPEFESLRKPLDPSVREQITEAIQSNPRISPDELSEAFSIYDIEAYFSNPDAEGFESA
jgi:hypothetical protein